MVRTLMSAPPTERVGRYPKHKFQVLDKPFALTPLMIAPVLPGETMQNLYFESRVITDPILNPIVGWKKEYFFFYVKVTDLLNDTIRDMFIDPTNTDLTATLGVAANDFGHYTAKGSIDYLKRCVDRIAGTYFLDEDEAITRTANGVSGYPIVHIKENSFLDSLTDKDLLPEGAAIASATDMGDLDRLLDAFEHLRAMGVANMTYEDFLRSYGISIPDKDENKPEMLCHFSDFQYPSNTVDPGTGVPSSAVSWVFRNGHRKPKFFKEPGFVVGLTVTRPKVYFSGLAGNAAGFMGRAWDWMPAMLADMPETQLKNFAAATGPLGDTQTDTDAYWLDMRDLLLYGDQFHNVVPFVANTTEPTNVGGFNIIALPDNNLNWKKPTETMIQSFFKDTATPYYYVRQDGYVSLGIKGKQVDFTVGNFSEV